MIWLKAILFVLSPGILYALALLAVVITMRYYRRRCPSCGQRGLKFTGFVKATARIEGRRAPDSWSYYVCERCGARYKLHHGEWKRMADIAFTVGPRPPE